MIADSIAPFAWGIQIGAWSFYLLNARFSRPTNEHVIGAEIIRRAKSAADSLRFAPDCVVTNTDNLILADKRRVSITLEARKPHLINEVSA